MTNYKKENKKKLNLKYLYIINIQTQVYVFAKMRKKLKNRAGQGVFIGYKKKNLYKIYYLLTKKIY